MQNCLLNEWILQLKFDDNAKIEEKYIIIKISKYECSFKNDKNPLLCAFSISVFLHELGNMFVMCNVFLKWQIF